MKFWTGQSISDKLMRMTLLVSGTALLLAYISFLIYDLYSLRQHLMSAMATEANIVGANSVTALMFDDKQAAESTLSALRNSPQIRAAVILRPDGTEFARYLRDPSVPFELTNRLNLIETQRCRAWRHLPDLVVRDSLFKLSEQCPFLRYLDPNLLTTAFLRLYVLDVSTNAASSRSSIKMNESSAWQEMASLAAGHSRSQEAGSTLTSRDRTRSGP